MFCPLLLSGSFHGLPVSLTGLWDSVQLSVVHSAVIIFFILLLPELCVVFWTPVTTRFRAYLLALETLTLTSRLGQL